MITRVVKREFPADWDAGKIRGGADHAMKVCGVPPEADEHSQVVKRRGEKWVQFIWSWRDYS